MIYVVLLMLGMSGFCAAPLSRQTIPQGLTDLDGDGKPDLLRTTWNGRDTLIISNNGRFPFATLAQGTNWSDALDRAFNVDEQPRKVWNPVRAAWGDYEIVVDNNGDGIYDGVEDFFYHALDINGDGKPEGDVSLGLIGPAKNEDGVIKTDIHLDGTLPTAYLDFKQGRYAANEQDYSGHSRYYMNVQGTGFFLNCRYHDPMPMLRGWEIPIAWYDFSGTGHNDLIIRCTDISPGWQLGKYGEFEVAFELNRNNKYQRYHSPDVQLTFKANPANGGGYPYAERHKQDIKFLRGRPDADFIFLKKPQLHTETHRQFAPVLDVYKLCMDFEEWENVYLLFDEDDEDVRWEEMFSPSEPEWKDLADHLGDRYEVDQDFSGRGKLYVGSFDGRLHLYGADDCLWTADYYGMYHSQDRPDSAEGRQPPVGLLYRQIRYFDDNRNGFIDRLVYSTAQYGREKETEKIEREVSLLAFATPENPEPDRATLFDAKVNTPRTGFTLSQWDGNPVDLSRSPAKAGSDKMRGVFRELADELWNQAQQMLTTVRELGMNAHENDPECSPDTMAAYSRDRLAQLRDYRPQAGYQSLTYAHNLRERYYKGYWLKEKVLDELLNALSAEAQQQALRFYYTGQIQALCDYVRGHANPIPQKPEKETMDKNYAKLAARCSQAEHQAIKYLLAKVESDGSYAGVNDDLAAYYKSPYVLFALGQTEQARRSLDYIEKTFLAADGDLQPNGLKTQIPVYADNLSHYMNTWVVRGAASLGREELARKMLTYLKNQQDPQTGGIYRTRTTKQADIGTTAAFGLAALDTGDIPAAVRAGDFLMAALSNQSGGDDFYLCFEGNQPVRDFPAQQAGFFVIKPQTPGQAYWYPGIAMAFLTRLEEESGSHVYVDGTRRFMEVITRCADDRYSTLASGKVAWGAKLLYRRTGDRRLLEAAETVAENLLAQQDQDGCWILTGLAGSPQDVAAVTYDVTSEIALWIHELEELLRDS